VASHLERPPSGCPYGVACAVGFIGLENARFRRFVRGPYAVFDYLAGLVRLSSQRYIGQSPTGGAMIVALLVMIAASAGTGMASLAAMEGRGTIGRC